jgi:hypothetical protein
MASNPFALSERSESKGSVSTRLRLAQRERVGLAIALLLVGSTAFAQEPEPTPTPTPAPTFDDGFRAGVEDARKKPVYDWLAIGGGASLLTSGCATPIIGLAPFSIEKPRIDVPRVDPACGPAYSLGYEEGFEITVKRRRAAAGWLGSATVALALAAGLGIVNYRAAERARREGDAEGSLVVSPALFRF